MAVGTGNCHSGKAPGPSSLASQRKDKEGDVWRKACQKWPLTGIGGHYIEGV